ncbi:hypothetical protein PFISCL1PPCAC_17992 [Pristionchus fissidentatus]|uniref:Uncharacterized protein n=1 Tax=Pristionchus fissidentatus TaxID=1538716 RepID=A0AAV5W7V8_9BILA|nr:hypothetical protein PFISCL1PPCAC_17992 [Pristionchus fissidentatus]
MQLVTVSAAVTILTCEDEIDGSMASVKWECAKRCLAPAKDIRPLGDNNCFRFLGIYGAMNTLQASAKFHYSRLTYAVPSCGERYSFVFNTTNVKILLPGEATSKNEVSSAETVSCLNQCDLVPMCSQGDVPTAVIENIDSDIESITIKGCGSATRHIITVPDEKTISLALPDRTKHERLFVRQGMVVVDQRS